MEKVALAPWRRGAGEIERPQARRPDRASDRLDDVGIAALFVAADHGGERRDIHRRVAKRSCDGTDGLRRDGRQVALQVDYGVVAPIGIDDGERLEDAVGARWMVLPRHHRLAADLMDGIGDEERVGRHHDPAEIGLHGPTPDMDDHRLVADHRKRLSWEAGGRHARRYEDQGRSQSDHACRYRAGRRKVASAPDLYELQTTGQTG